MISKNVSHPLPNDTFKNRIICHHNLKLVIWDTIEYKRADIPQKLMRRIVASLCIHKVQLS
jgi:hypothetical protein